MTTIFDIILEYKIAGVLPVWPFIPIIILGLIAWLIITRKPRIKEYKPINMKEEVKKDLDIQYKYFGEAVGKPIYSGLLKLGWVKGYMPMIWNKRLKRYENIKKYNIKDLKKLDEVAKEIYEKAYDKLTKEERDGIQNIIREETKDEGYAEIVMDGEKPKIFFGKKEITYDETVAALCFKVCSSSIISKMLASLLGIGLKYFIIEQKHIEIKEDSIQMQEGLQRQYFYGQFIFSKSGKELIDNTAFRIDRENQLQEIANQIPRTVFFDTEASKRAMAMREVAEIEAKKFRSQQEGQQD